jgi:hypothetical protein
MNDLPVYTFRVNTVDEVALASQTLPNSFENIVMQLKSAEVLIPYWKTPLRHGMCLLYQEQKQLHVVEHYIGKEPKVLEISLRSIL